MFIVFINLFVQGFCLLFVKPLVGVKSFLNLYLQPLTAVMKLAGKNIKYININNKNNKHYFYYVI